MCLVFFTQTLETTFSPLSNSSFSFLGRRNRKCGSMSRFVRYRHMHEMQTQGRCQGYTRRYILSTNPKMFQGMYIQLQKMNVIPLVNKPYVNEVNLNEQNLYYPIWKWNPCRSRVVQLGPGCRIFFKSPTFTACNFAAS